MTDGKRLARGLALSAAVLFFVNALLLLYAWLPEYRFARMLATSPDLLAVYFLVFLWARLPEKRDRLISLLLGALAGAVFFFSAGEAFTRYWYNQPFVPRTDLGYISAIVKMVLHIDTGPAAAIGAVLLAIAAIAFGLSRLFGWAIREVRGASLFYLALPAAFLVLSLTLGFNRAALDLITKSFKPGEPAVITAAPEPPAVTKDADHHFPFLRDGDVYLILVESYGHTLFTNQSHRELILPFYEEYGTILEEGGLFVYSNFLDSPTSGGRSWFADATLWTGSRVDSQELYDALVGSGVKSLPAVFRDAGYFSAIIAPGTDEASGEWRATYPFSRFLFRPNLEYAGPFFNLGAMPDQLILKRTAQAAEDPEGEGKPFFAVVILVSSHVPFDQIPRYVEDWDAIGDGAVFNDMEMLRFANNWLGGDEYPEGYTAGIRYSLKSSFEFLLRYLPENGVAVVLGDHQPRFPVRERDASSSVPIHIVSRRKDLPAAFSAFGFTPGLIPEQPPPHRGMEHFMSDFLTVAYGRPAAP